MENSVASETQEEVTAASEMPKSEKQLAMMVYAFQAISVLVGITALVGIIINYIKRGDITNEVIRSHFTYQIRTFWWMLGWVSLGLVTSVVGVGVFVILAAGVWYVYRFVKGGLRLNDGQAI